MTALDEHERHLARHALGLNGRARRAYRNHYVCETHPVWESMVGRGLASVRRSAESEGRHTYRLTREGATAALAPGETLADDLFPESA